MYVCVCDVLLMMLYLTSKKLKVNKKINCFLYEKQF